MISGIGSSMSYFNSPLFATNGANSTSGSNSSSRFAQTEERLFAAIDTNGDGSLNQSEFTNFLDKTSAAAGGNPSQAASALFSQMSNDGSSISLQQFESNVGNLVSALSGQPPAGSSSGSSSVVSTLLSNLTQSAQSLIAGSAAGIANSTNSTATSNTHDANGAGHNHHHRHSDGSLISQFMRQYQAAGATAATSSVLSASA